MLYRLQGGENHRRVMCTSPYVFGNLAAGSTRIEKHMSFFLRHCRIPGKLKRIKQAKEEAAAEVDQDRMLRDKEFRLRQAKVSAAARAGFCAAQGTHGAERTPFARGRAPDRHQTSPDRWLLSFPVKAFGFVARCQSVVIISHTGCIKNHIFRCTN